MIEQVLGDCSMRACTLAGINLYLVKKTLATDETLASSFKIQRLPGQEVKFSSTWSHKDGEENPDYPDYIWIVGKQI